VNIERSPQPPRRLHPFILLAAFVSTFSIGLISPILPALAEGYGGNAFTVGLLFASYSFAQFLSAPILGAISDRYGRRAVMLVSLCGAVLGFSIFAISGALWLLFVGWMIVGVADCCGHGDRTSAGSVGGRLVIPSCESIRSLWDGFNPSACCCSGHAQV
jgi:DHA1 family tetracycline resistance protein-like MFS transporter